MTYYGPQRPIKVYCIKCADWKQEQDVCVLDISEGMQGEDRLKFRCPDCKTEQTSTRIG